jgi:hypothetical protein
VLHSRHARTLGATVVLGAAGFKNQLGQRTNTQHVAYRPSTPASILLDTTPPQALALSHCGTSAPCSTSLAFVCSTSCLYFTWPLPSDPRGSGGPAVSGLASVRLTAQRSVAGGPFVDYFDTLLPDVTTTTFSKCDVAIAPGTRVNASLILTDKAGNVFSRPGDTIVVVDGTPARAPSTGVANGYTPGRHVATWNSTWVGAAAYSPFTDAESGVVSYLVELVSGTPTGPALKWTTLTPAQHAAGGHVVVLSPLDLSCGSANVYYWRVTATNSAGCPSVATSPSFVVDTTAPVTGGVVAEAVVFSNTIGFDDLPALPVGCTSTTPVPTSYRGLKWDNAYYLGQCPTFAPATSGVNTAFNGVW